MRVRAGQGSVRLPRDAFSVVDVTWSSGRDCPHELRRLVWPQSDELASRGTPDRFRVIARMRGLMLTLYPTPHRGGRLRVRYTVIKEC